MPYFDISGDFPASTDKEKASEQRFIIQGHLRFSTDRPFFRTALCRL